MDELDKQIIVNARPDWRKVALLVAKIGESSGIDHETIAARIGALVADGKLEAQGDLSQWRFSEIRLPPH